MTKVERLHVRIEEVGLKIAELRSRMAALARAGLRIDVGDQLLTQLIEAERSYRQELSWTQAREQGKDVGLMSAGPGAAM
jgi:hypothetical protein